MHFSLLFLFFAVLQALEQAAPPEEDLGIEGTVVLDDITPEELKQMIQEATTPASDGANKKSLLVNFFAPWCGHCKNLAGPYSEIATQLAESVVFAKMDCVKYSDACKAQGVTYYPTLIFFHAHSGEKGEEYPGKTDAVMIKNWVTMHFEEPGVVLETKEQLNNFVKEGLSKQQLVLVGYFSDEDLGKKYKVWVSQLYLNNKPNTFRYGIAPATLFSSSSVSSDDKKNAVVLYTSFDHGEYVVDFTSNSDLNKWLKDRELPLCGDITPKNFEHYKEQKLPLVLVLMSKTAPLYSEWTNAMTKLAEEFRGKFLFGRIDMDKYKDLTFRLGITTNVVPAVVITNAETRKHYPLHLEYSVENVREHCQGYLQNKLAPLSRTQLRPSSDRTLQESQAGPQGTGIKDIYTTTWDATVKDISKHVLVFFDAPWCQECKLLRIKYPLVAEHFRNQSNVLIATIDVSSNEGAFAVPDVLPGLTFFPSDNKLGIPYVGGRDFEELKFFLTQKIEDAEKRMGNRLGSPPVEDIEFPEHDEI